MSGQTYKEMIVQSKSAKRMIETVSPIYEDAYVGCWLFEDIGREWDRIWAIIDEMPDQLSPLTVTWLIGLWERRYDITPNVGDTLEQRRSRIIQAEAPPRAFSPWLIQRYVKSVYGRDVQVIERVSAYTFAVVIENHYGLLSLDLNDVIRFINKNKPSHLSYNLKVETSKQLKLYTGCAYFNAEKHTYKVSEDGTSLLDCYADEFGDMLLDEHGYPMIVED